MMLSVALVSVQPTEAVHTPAGLHQPKKNNMRDDSPLGKGRIQLGTEDEVL